MGQRKSQQTIFGRIVTSCESSRVPTLSDMITILVAVLGPGQATVEEIPVQGSMVIWADMVIRAGMAIRAGMVINITKMTKGSIVSNSSRVTRAIQSS